MVLCVDVPYTPDIIQYGKIPSVFLIKWFFPNVVYEPWSPEIIEFQDLSLPVKKHWNNSNLNSRQNHVVNINAGAIIVVHVLQTQRLQ